MTEGSIFPRDPLSDGQPGDDGVDNAPSDSNVIFITVPWRGIYQGFARCEERDELGRWPTFNWRASSRAAWSRLLLLLWRLRNRGEFAGYDASAPMGVSGMSVRDQNREVETMAFIPSSDLPE